MSTRPIYLAKSRGSRAQRAHFAIFILNAGEALKDPSDKSISCKGTIIHVIGAPMAGYTHEFKRNYDASGSERGEEYVHLGSIPASSITDPSVDTFSTDSNALGALDAIALRLPAPRKSENFLAPVNDTTNRRCQEWTMEYLRALVQLNYIHPNAVTVAEAHRDPPEHGVALRTIVQA